MIKARVYNIDWEVDDADQSKAVDLPSEVALEVEPTEDTSDLEEQISDMLSDEYDFLHNGFDYELNP